MTRDTRDVLRMTYGMALLIILAGLALAIAIGHVEEKTSYGLMPLLVSISHLSGQFAQWAFSSSHTSQPAAPAAKHDAPADSAPAA